MRRFKWIDWNIGKIAAHALSADEVESAFDNVLYHRSRRDGSFETYARTTSGRTIWIIWRYDEEQGEEGVDVLLGLDEPIRFVITAY